MSSVQSDGRPASSKRKSARPGGQYWASILTGIVLAASVSWLGAFGMVRAGYTYDGAVIKSGTAVVQSCRKDGLLVIRCASRVTWADGKQQQVDVLTPKRLDVGASVAVDQHPHTVNDNSVTIDRPVTMTKDFPSGKNGTPLKILLAIGALVAAFFGFVAGGTVHGRIARRRASL